MTDEHEEFMRMCFQLARQAAQNGNRPYGAILVKEGEVLHTAETTQFTEQDCTRHAEVNLISEAHRKYGADILTQCSLYSSTEPCLMCSGAIYWAEIPVVVFGCSTEAFSKLADIPLIPACKEVLAQVARSIEVIGPVLEQEAVQIHADYLKSIEAPNREA